MQVNSYYILNGHAARVLAMWMQQMAGTDRQYRGYDQYSITEGLFGEYSAAYTGGGLIDMRTIEAAADASGNRILGGITRVWEALVMSFVANRLRFGRYVFSIGGNPEASELAGIKTRRTIVKVFMTMGILVAISAAVSIARLNAAVSGLGTLNELYVIAAAVVGGTSLSGGIGTIPGAILGALVMQSLQSGMVLVGIGAPIQDVVLGVALVIAVAIDTIYRRRST